MGGGSDIAIPHRPVEERIPSNEVNIILFVKETVPAQLKQINTELRNLELRAVDLTQEKQTLESLLAIVTKQQ